MPLHDYRCPAHGLFESFEAACKVQGCQETVTTVYLKPVGTVSARTRGIDRDLRANMEAFGMTDLNSAREGDNHAKHMPRAVPFREEVPVSKMPSNIEWGSWGTKNPGTVFGGDKAQDINTAVKSPVQQFGNALSSKTVVTHRPPNAIKMTAKGLSE